MESIWKLKINKNNIISPKAFLEQQSNYLLTLTDEKLYLEIKEYNPPIYEEFENYTKKLGAKISSSIPDKTLIKPGDKLPNAKKNMSFQVNLKSRVIDYFAFHIMTYEHNIEIYPVTINVNPDIEFITEKINDLNEQDFKSAVKTILNTKKMDNTVNALYNLSCKN